MSEWCGYALAKPGGPEVAYHVGPVPYRSSIALSRHEGVTSEAVGYFRTEEQAREFLGWLHELATKANAR